MNNKINLLERIKERIEKYKENKEKERLEEKQDIINLVTRSWSKFEVDSYIATITINSGGWLGKDFTEKDCKSLVLQHNCHLFTHEEFRILYNGIFREKVMKK